MANYSAAVARTSALASADRPTMGIECDSVCGAQWLSVADVAQRFSSLEHTVYGIFWQWRKDDTWQRIHDRLLEQVHRAVGKRSTPTANVIDSQSIRTAEGGEERGYDIAKQITGRKRHLVVDTRAWCWQS